MIRKYVVPIMVILLGLSAVASAKITLKRGEMAPNFALWGTNGKLNHLSSFRGHWVVLYFYVKDETPGCTTEACKFRNHLGTIRDMDAKVIGISTQTVKSHLAFAKKYGLDFLLLADPECKVSKMYGVYNPKWKLDDRVTFLLNPKGQIVKIYPKVDPVMNAQQIIYELKKFTGKPARMG